MAALVYEMLRERSEMVRGERREGKMSFFVTKKIGLNLFFKELETRTLEDIAVEYLTSDTPGGVKNE